MLQTSSFLNHPHQYSTLSSSSSSSSSLASNSMYSPRVESSSSFSTSASSSSRHHHDQNHLSSTTSSSSNGSSSSGNGRSVLTKLGEMGTWKCGIDVGPSTIPDAGRGVFATKVFALTFLQDSNVTCFWHLHLIVVLQVWTRGSFVTEFSGLPLSREEAVARRKIGNHLYIRSIDWDTLVDGIKEVCLSF
jgi:hypothetical protein